MTVRTDRNTAITERSLKARVGKGVNPERSVVAILALAVVVLGFGWAFFTEHTLSFDDIHLFNISYMYKHYGTLTYPAHNEFEALTLHPPPHHWLLGTLLKAGIPFYYAEAIPPYIFFLLSVLLIVYSPFSRQVKLGLLVALCVPLLNIQFFPRVRPDLHRALAMYAGLIALEGGRLKHWNIPRLSLGSALLTYASILHYPGFLTWTGVLVYLVWALRAQGWGSGFKSVLAMTAAGCLIGVPFLLFFVVPQWPAIIHSVSAVDPTRGGIPASVAMHFEVYARMFGSPQTVLPFSANPLTKFVFYPMTLKIPLVLLSFATLFSLPKTRGMALASLPYPLFLLLFNAHHKEFWWTYFLPELMLYVAGVGAVAFSGLGLVAKQLRPNLRWLPVSAGAASVIGSVLLSSALPFRIDLSLGTPLYEPAVARAATGTYLDSSALVGSRAAVMFYAGGGHHYYDISRDLLSRARPPENLQDYFAAFDALVEHPIFSDRTSNDDRKSLIAWYAEGNLQLRGFYFSHRNLVLNYLVLNAHRADLVQGFGMSTNGQLHRFYEQSNGDHVLVTAQCPVETLERVFYMEYSAAFRIPLQAGASKQEEMRAFITPMAWYKRKKPGIEILCRIRDEIRLAQEPIERNLEATLASESPIRFYKHFKQALEGRYGPVASIEVEDDGWPVALAFRRGPHVRYLGELEGARYLLKGETGAVLTRLDFESLQPLQVMTYTDAGGLEIESAHLGADDFAGRFSSGDRRDHVATRFQDRGAKSSELIFFSLWAKPSRGDALPVLWLQDEENRFLSRAKPWKTRPDGWALLAGWARDVKASKLRLVVLQEAGEVSLLDKLLLVSTSGTPPQ